MKTKFMILIAALGLATASSRGQISVNSLGTFTENFNNLADTGSDIAWVNDNPTRGTTGMPGWYWISDGGDQPYDTSNGSSTTGTPFSYGTDSDRAMGNLGGGDNDNTAWGVVFLNNTGADITSFNLSYIGEQWREGTNGAGTNVLSFSYLVSSTDITDFDNLGGATPTGWTAFNSLDFASIHGTTEGALDGNLVANRSSISNTITATVANGEYIAFRWYAPDASGTDSGIAIDDFSVTAIPEPSSIILIGLVGLAAVVVLRKRK